MHCPVSLTLVAVAQDHLAELQAQFNQESDPVRKAKALMKFGDAQFELLGKQADAGNYGEALHVLQEYREEVKVTHAALKATGLDAEKKPGGFKQLQIHVRKSLRKLNQTITSLPYKERDPFEAIRRELEEIDKELVDMLFPRQPGRRPETEKRKGE